MGVVPSIQASRARPSAVLWLVVAGACWGLDTTLSSYALRQLRPADLFSLETVVAVAAVWTYLGVTRGFRRPTRLMPHVMLGAIEPGFAYLLFDLGLKRTSAVSGGLLLSTETLLGVLLGVVFLKERLTRAAKVSLALGTAGALLIPLGEAGQGATVVGDLIVLAASATAACYVLVGRKLPRQDDTLSGTAVQLLTAAVIALGYAAFTWGSSGSAIPTSSAPYLAVGATTGIIGIAIPFFLLNRALALVPASFAALSLNLTPVFAVASAVVVLMEGVSANSLAGGSLILLAGAILALVPENPLLPEGQKGHPTIGTDPISRADTPARRS